MNSDDHKTIDPNQLERPLAPKKSRLQEFWQLFRQNRLAIIGLVIFIIFFCIASVGLLLTSGTKPVFDPAMVRLQEKLRPPLARPNLDSLAPSEVPAFNRYFFSTDDLGRDVFARMLQGAWVSLTVGFVAVGISVIIGIFLGGILSALGSRRIQPMVERGPRISAKNRLILAFAGGILVGFASRLARGCTSGQGLTGTALLFTGSVLFLVCMFLGAYAAAVLVRREWL